MRRKRLCAATTIFSAPKTQLASNLRCDAAPIRAAGRDHRDEAASELLDSARSPAQRRACCVDRAMPRLAAVNRHADLEEAGALRGGVVDAGNRATLCYHAGVGKADAKLLADSGAQK